MAEEGRMGRKMRPPSYTKESESGHSAKVPLTRESLDRHVVASDRVDPGLWNTTVCSSSLPCGSPTVTKSTQIIAAGLLAGLLCTEHC